MKPRGLRSSIVASIFGNNSRCENEKAATRTTRRLPSLVKGLLQFETSKEISNLKRRRLLAIRAVDRVLADRSRILLPDRSLFGLRRVGRAHQLAQVGNGILLLKNHREDRPAGHKLRQLTKERTLLVNIIEPLGLRLGDRNLLDRN